MQELLAPLQNPSLKDVFIERFEELILSGQLKIGQKLPSERELALQLGVSRPVVHNGLVDLEAKGLVTLIPRVGAVVNDYRREGSLALLNSLVTYQKGRLETELQTSLLDVRRIFEVETARLAALHREDAHLNALQEVLEEEMQIRREAVARIAALDFRFHHLLTLASGNRIYPLLINSFKPVYLNLVAQFFQNPAVVKTVHAFHRKLFQAIDNRDEAAAVAVMQRMLLHGADHLQKVSRTE
ncbi:MAG: FadR family transcriptional regulator [Desulfosarcina sp.]|nr:FadR family transcriptional regulator [Desulfobacterales bacterium]